MSIKKKALLFGYEDFEEKYTGRFASVTQYLDHAPSDAEIEQFMDENPEIHHVTVARFWEKQDWENPAIQYDWGKILQKLGNWMSNLESTGNTDIPSVNELGRLFDRYTRGERSLDLYWEMSDFLLD